MLDAASLRPVECIESTNQPTSRGDQQNDHFSHMEVAMIFFWGGAGHYGFWKFAPVKLCVSPVRSLTYTLSLSLSLSNNYGPLPEGMRSVIGSSGLINAQWLFWMDHSSDHPCDRQQGSFTSQNWCFGNEFHDQILWFHEGSILLHFSTHLWQNKCNRSWQTHIWLIQTINRFGLGWL